MFSNFLNPLAIMISLTTASGLLLHDLRIDKAATTALAVPVSLAAYEVGNKMVSFTSDAHTHAERSSFSQAASELNATNPRIQPRTEDKKYLMQKRVMRGHHAFDNYNLPIV